MRIDANINEEEEVIETTRLPLMKKSQKAD
jgi:hypothetical protein